MSGDGFQQLAGDLVGIGVEEADPAQLFDLRQPLQQQRQPIFQAEVFAVAGGVLPDQRDLAHALLRQALRFGDDGLKAARAKLAAKLRNNAERAGMIAALGNLDVGRVLRRRQNARGVLVVEIVRQIGDGAVPIILGESSGSLASIAFGTREFRMTNGGSLPSITGWRLIPAALSICSSSPVPTTASTSGMFF